MGIAIGRPSVKGEVVNYTAKDLGDLFYGKKDRSLVGRRVRITGKAIMVENTRWTITDDVAFITIDAGADPVHESG